MRYKTVVRIARTLLLIASIQLVIAANALGQSPASPRDEGIRANRIVVTPNGPQDGGDFGPHTPGTKTSGLQEAFDAAKAQAKDLYISGGSWTADKTKPVVYVLHETLRIPWMQDFRMESGHCVIHYAKKTGDAVVFDSQMSSHSQGIEGAIGARIFGDHNLLTLSTSQMSPGGDVVFEPSAADNLITAIRLPNGVTNRATRPTNRIVGTEPIGYRIATPPVPASGAEIVNRYPHGIEVRILVPGKVTAWTETDASGNARAMPGGLHAGQALTLEPGDKLQFQYAEPPQWIWKGLR